MKTSQNIPPTVKVFYFDLNKIDSITNGQLENKLSLKQQIEISTFKNPKIRLQKTLSKLCLNWLIKQQGLPFDYIDNLSYSPLGKPYFPNVSFGFNFSHSNRLMSFAYSDTLSDIGVDVQEIVSIKKMEKLLPKLCQSEQDFLSNHPNKPLGFTQIWAQKESIVKQQAESITKGLHQIDTQNEPMLFKEKSFELYPLDLGDFSANFVGYLALESSEITPTILQKWVNPLRLT